MIAATGGIGAYVHPHLVRDTYRGIRALRLAGGGLVPVQVPKRRVRKAVKTVRKTAKRVGRKARNTRNRVVKGIRAYY